MFEEMKGYGVVQQEVHIRAFGTRWMEERKRYLERQTHFEELVANCGEADEYQRHDCCIGVVTVTLRYLVVRHQLRIETILLPSAIGLRACRYRVLCQMRELLYSRSPFDLHK